MSIHEACTGGFDVSRARLIMTEILYGTGKTILSATAMLLPHTPHQPRPNYPCRVSADLQASIPIEFTTARGHTLDKVPGAARRDGAAAARGDAAGRSLTVSVLTFHEQWQASGTRETSAERVEPTWPGLQRFVSFPLFCAAHSIPASVATIVVIPVTFWRLSWNVVLLSK